MVWLHYADGGEPGWDVGPAGVPVWPNEDYMLRVFSVLPVPGDESHILWRQASRTSPASRKINVPLETGEWYRWTIESCGDTVRIAAVRLRDSTTVTENLVSSVVVAPADYYMHVFVMLGGEAPDKAFDNLYVWRGCTGD